uniref:Uncharacterized protein n=3 Tax=Caenorhabditis japonica TaxID=281687 RepID=A0A8R1IGU4_CAEJA
MKQKERDQNQDTTSGFVGRAPSEAMAASSKQQVNQDKAKQSNVTNVTDTDTTPTNVFRDEIEKLCEQKVLLSTSKEPRCISPLHVVVQGEKKRMILDLSELNKMLIPPRF